MGRSVNFDAVPDSNIVPEGVYVVSIETFEETASQQGKLMYNARLEIIEPADLAGMGIFETFVIGNDDDPDASNEDTWVKSIGCQRMKKMLKCANVPLDTDMDNVVAAALQQQLSVSVVQQVDDGKRDARYKGNVRNRISQFYPLGTKEAGITAPATTAAPAAKPPVAAVAKPAVAKPAAPAVARTPVAGVLSKPAGAPKPAVSKAPVKAAVVHCTICDTDVARDEFADHVEAHSNEA